MKRLIKQNLKSIQASGAVGDNSYDFIFNLRPPSEIPQDRIEITSTELAQAFKAWYIQNWVDQGNEIEGLKYIGLLSDTIFDAWVRVAQTQYCNLFPYILEEAKFHLRSERILR